MPPDRADGACDTPLSPARRAVLGFGVVLTAGLCAEPSGLWSKQPELVSANVAEVRKGYRTGWLVGHDVLNDRNETVGTITELVLSQDYALFAVLEVGGFLDSGEHLVAVPIRAVAIDEARHTIVLPGATRKALRDFPQFHFPN